MNTLVITIGPWLWWIVAAALLVGELLAPGVFLIWLAAAAALTGLIDLAFGISFQLGLVLFAVFSVVLVHLSPKLMARRGNAGSDQPHLNNRMKGFVGRQYYLETAIHHGVGKVRIEDALWDVEGPDMRAQTKITITGINGMRLTGEKAD